MKPILSATILSVTALPLVACGSESNEPVEQIVVREPGETAPSAGESETEAAQETGADGAELIEAGKSAFAMCAACHVAEEGAPSGIGPNLHNIVGQSAGGVDGFGYSDAMANSGLTWDEETLDAFLSDPQAKVPGTNMAAGAVSDAEKRAAIIAYLSSLGG